MVAPVNSDWNHIVSELQTIYSLRELIVMPDNDSYTYPRNRLNTYSPLLLEPEKVTQKA